MNNLKRIDDILVGDEENLTPFQLVDNYRRLSEYVHTLKDKFIDAYWSIGEEGDKKVYNLLHELDRTLFDNSGEDE